MRNKKIFAIVFLVILLVVLVSSCERDTNYIYVGQSDDTTDVTPQGQDITPEVTGTSDVTGSESS